MKRTIYPTQRSGILADTDLVRPRHGSRTVRPLFPTEQVIRIDLGDPADAVDSGWRTWIRNSARVA